jgi:universal stress protein A
VDPHAYSIFMRCANSSAAGLGSWHAECSSRHVTSISRILVPVDFSEASRAALDYAATLARTFGATLDVLHVWEAPSFAPRASGLVSSGAGEPSLQDLIRRNADEALDGFSEEARKRGILVRSSRTEMGVPWHTIVNEARAGNYDLVVLGTHGRTGLPRVLLGSVAENVVRHAHCPVLSVRPEKHSNR